MNILVLGAAGRLGQQVVIEALDQGHEVTAFVRNPAILGKRHDKVQRLRARKVHDQQTQRLFRQNLIG